MNAHEAATLVEGMFHANGRSMAPPVIAELAKDVAAASCPSCAKDVIDQAHDHGPALNVPQFRAAYSRQHGSPDHAFHLGQQEGQVDVGKIEARWRTEGVKRAQAAGHDKTTAEILAARMWASQAVSLENVREEALEPVWVDTMPEGTPEEWWAEGRRRELEAVERRG